MWHSLFHEEEYCNDISFGEKVNTLKIHFCQLYSPVISKNTCTDIRYSRIGVNFYRCTNSFHESLLLHDLDTMQARRSRPRLTFSLVPPADFAFEIFFSSCVFSSSHPPSKACNTACWLVRPLFYWALISL